tara:strand:- start:1095 stop:1481 length:387 start_codon:yes stop_codon:yes gene_type:complete
MKYKGNGLIVNMFAEFVKRWRQLPEYDALMEHKERDHFNLTSEQFLCMLFVHDLIDSKLPVKNIIKQIPPKHHWVLRDILKARLNPKRLHVNWTLVQKSCANASGFCKTFDTYLRTYYPFGYHSVKVK